MAGSIVTATSYTEQRDLDNFEAKAVVRKFSIEVAAEEPDDFMAQSLVRYTETEEATDRGLTVAVVREMAWRGLYESEPRDDDVELRDLDDVANESRILQNVWQDFVLELEQQNAKTDKKKRWLSNLPNTQELNIDSLNEVVLTAESVWRAKGQGKIQRSFHKFSANINSHSVLLDILPGQSQYGSIFVGTLKTLIQASANHERVAEILADSMSKITTKLSLCVTQYRLYGIDGIKKGIERIYARFFQFIRTAIEWYQTSKFKRALKSMNHNFPESFKSQVEDIMEIADEVHEFARTAHGAETRDSRITVQQTANEVAQLQRKAESTEQKMDELFSLAAKLAIGQNMSNLLLLDIQAEKYREEARRHHALPGNGRIMMIEDVSSSHLSVAPLSARPSMEDLRSASASLKNYTYEEEEFDSLNSSQGIFLEHRAVAALDRWTKSATSQTLWLITGLWTSRSQIASRIAANVALAASKARIPVVRVRHLSVSSADTLDGYEKEQKSLVNILYTLIQQVMQLSKRSLTETDLTVEMISKLDGTLETWYEGLHVLSEALALAPPLLLLILDGLDGIDTAETGEHIESLLSLLQKASRSVRERNDDEGNGYALKLLFTTTIHSSALQSVLDNDDIDEDEGVEVVRCKKSRDTRASRGKLRSGASKLRTFESNSDEGSDAENGS